MKSARPKMLHEVGGRSMLSHALHAAGGLKPAHLVTVIGHGRDMVEEAIKAIDIPTTTVVQEEQNGTGDAVRVGLTAIPAGFAGTVIVTTSDVPLLDTATLASLPRPTPPAPPLLRQRPLTPTVTVGSSGFPTAPSTASWKKRTPPTRNAPSTR